MPITGGPSFFDSTEIRVMAAIGAILSIAAPKRPMFLIVVEVSFAAEPGPRASCRAEKRAAFRRQIAGT
jgi:hypothetical protein